jgi:predicted extracellular nuclease
MIAARPRRALLPLVSIGALLLALIVAVAGPGPRPALAAAVITRWDFNSNPSDASSATGTTAPVVGSGTAALVGGTTATFAGGIGSTDSVVNDNSAWNVSAFPAQNTGNETAGAQFSVSTVGQRNIVVSWDQRNSSTAARHVRFQYSTDGATFTNFGDLLVLDPGGAWFNTRSFDLSTVPGASNNPNFAFRIVAAFDPAANSYTPSTLPGNYTTSGTWRFDMVAVSGDPLGATPLGPTITTQPADQSITTGGTATLTVVANGTAPMSYQWYQGVAPDTSTPVGADSPTFTTPALSATASYWVRVTNGTGSADSRTATVTVAAQPPEACAAPDTPIGQVQGAADASPLAGQTVTVQGVVVGDYEGAAPNLRGFYIESLAPDADPATSEGLFIFNNSADTFVSLGQLVQVTGAVSEFQGQTQITRAASEVCAGAPAPPAPAELSLPFPAAVGGVPYLERFEGMLVRATGASGAPLVVTEHFQLGRFGQVTVAGGERLYQPTNVVAPGGPGSPRDQLQQANDRNRLILDDALQNQNRDPIYFGRGGQPLSAANTLRAGDTLPAAVGVLTFTWAGNAASGNAYRLRPEGALSVSGPPAFQPANPRPAAPPAVGGSLRVAAYNVLNYFLTLDYASGNPADNTCGPAQNQECRGADSPEEFARQRVKLLQALKGLDADVLGLIELENTPGVNPQADLAAGLNELTAAGAYAFVDTGVVGGDAIRVGILYKPARVTPVGTFKTLDKSVDPRFESDRQRPSLAQTFRVNATGQKFTVVVNHLKSKGDSGLAADPACAATPPTNPDCDQGDGQGFWNDTRRRGAQALVDWLKADPTGSGDPDYLLLGDMNSYAKEDPITALLAGPDDAPGTADDNVNLVLRFGGPQAYSYLFDGQLGYLDHAIASPSLAAQVTGAGEWHINADEPSVLDYNTEFKSPGQVAGLFASDPFRTSDHDPILVGLNLGNRVHLPLVRK